MVIAIQPNITKESSLFGDVLILLSCFVWAVYIVQLKRPQGEGQLTKEWFTAITLFLGSIMIIPLAFMEIWTGGLPVISWKAWGCIAYLSLFPTIAAYWLWNKGVEHISIARASAYLNAIPIIEIICCVLLLNETVTWRLLLGGSLVLIGVIIIEKNATKKILVSKDREQEYIS
nr:DMT family transporter [Peribacillus muralis]